MKIMCCCVLLDVANPQMFLSIRQYMHTANVLSISSQEPNRKQGQYWYPPDAQGSLAENQKFFEALIAACRSAVSSHVTCM